MIYIRRFPTSAIACAVCSIKRNFQEKKKSSAFHFEGGKMFVVSIQCQGLKCLLHWSMSLFDGFIWVAAPVGLNCLGPLYSKDTYLN